ncbi:MAG: hypothetical protein JNM56_10060 [Planctomycetia bacterium]|nr:hypothetical protein [Planctomycetia bacterium]
MPVPWDRFVRVVSGGKYGNTQDLFVVRRNKVNGALAEIDQLLAPFNPPAVAPNTFPELDGIRQEVVDYRATVQTALNLANADLRKATELLDPLKDQARATKERAQKMTARVEKLREVDLHYGTPEYQDDEQHQTTMKPFEDWDRTYPRAGQALVAMPTGAGALFDHIKVLDLYIVQLPLIAARVIHVGTNNGNGNVPPKIAEKYRNYARIQTECNDLVHSLTDRRNFLQGMLDKTPLTERQVYRSKAESVKAAIRQVNALIAGNPPNVVALNQVVQHLTQRSTQMTNNNSNKPVPNLDKVLGKKGGKAGRYRDMLTANGAAAIPTFPLVTPDCREDVIMEAVVEWCTRGAYPNLTEDEAKKRAKHGYHDAQIKELNEGKVWARITRPVQLEGKDGKPLKVESEIIPAAQLGNKFTAQMNGHGVNCHDTKAYKTTKNLAATELRNKDGEVIFKGLRHGINCAYGITPNKIKEMPDDELETMVNDLCVDDRAPEVRQRATLRRAIEAQPNNANPALHDLQTTGTAPNYGIDAATVKALGFTPAKVMQMNDRDRRKFLEKALAFARDDEAEARAALRARLTLLNQQGNNQGKQALLQEMKDNGKVGGVSVGALRRKANVNRSMDIVVAALVRNPDKLRAALLQPNKAVNITINSMSLVTPDIYRRGKDGDEDEAKMLREQMAAWEKVSADPQPRKVWVEDPNNGNQLTEVTVRIEVLAFNFGVNAGAVAYGAAPGSGWGTSNKYNEKAMDQLLGKKSERQKKLGGRVGRWLDEERESLRGVQTRLKDAVATLKEKQTELDRIPKNTQVLLEQQRRATLKNEIEDLKRDTRPMEEDFKKRLKNLAIVEKLAKQIAQIWDSSSYESQGKEPYKMVSRLAVLTHKMGDDPAFNCKSGKDRTGQLDAEAKLLVTQIEEDGDVPEPDHEPTEREKRNRYNGALNFGNHEMQELNTGHMGFKLKGVKALDKSLPDKEGVKTYRGSSGHTKS